VISPGSPGPAPQDRPHSLLIFRAMPGFFAPFPGPLRGSIHGERRSISAPSPSLRRRGHGGSPYPFESCERRHRGMTSQAQLGDERTFGVHTYSDISILDFAEQSKSARVARAAFEAERPWHGAGSISSVENITVACDSMPSRFRPARARTTPSIPPLPIFPRRVSILPRIGRKRISGRSMDIWMRLRSLPVATELPPGSSAKVRRSRPIKASRGSSRTGEAPSTKPSGRHEGRSLRLCTPTSMSPRRREFSMVRTKAPCPPKSVKGECGSMSPSVFRMRMPTSRSGNDRGSYPGSGLPGKGQERFPCCEVMCRFR